LLERYWDKPVTLFLCRGDSCADAKSKQLEKELKAAIKARGLKKRVKIVKVDCLDECKRAPNVLLVPPNLLASEVKSKDLNTLLDRLERTLDHKQ